MRTTVIALAVAVLAAGSGNATAEPTIETLDDKVLVQPNQDAGVDALTFEIFGLTGQPGTIEVRDTTAELEGITAEVTFDLPALLGTGETSSVWSVRATATGLPPAFSTERLALVVADNVVVGTIGYTLSNVPEVAFSWSVRSIRNGYRLLEGQPIELAVSVGPVPAANVSLLSASFVEVATKTRPPGAWSLCPTTTRCVDADISFAANSAQRLWLFPPRGATLAGEYDGTILIGADTDPEGQAIDLTVMAKPYWLQALGAIIIVFGVVAAWVATVMLPNRLNRAQLLLPAARLRDRAMALGNTIRELRLPASASPKALLADLAKAADALSEETLDKEQMIPGLMADPFGRGPPGLYQERLTQYSDWLTAVSLVVSKGLAAVVAIAERENATADQLSGPAKALLAQVPGPPEPTKPIQELSDAIATIVSGFEAEFQAAAARGGRGLRRGPADAASAELFTINNLRIVNWLIFGALSTVVGIFVLIVQPTSFGTLNDLFFCLFWGFGLSAGASQVAPSLSDVRTQLRISVPA